MTTRRGVAQRADQSLLILASRWSSLRGAYRAGRRDARLGRAPRSGLVAWPGTYMDGYRSSAKGS